MGATCLALGDATYDFSSVKKGQAAKKNPGQEDGPDTVV